MSRIAVIKYLVLLMVFFGAFDSVHGTIRYVKPDASGSGSSWSDAGNLQTMINASSSSGADEVWVAAGTYTPTVMSSPPNERTKTFTLKSGVKVYGGFFGNETSLEERDIEANITILSGDIGELEDASDNCYHVVTASGLSLDPESRLDGFTIRDGRATYNPDAPFQVVERGAGLYVTTGAAGEGSHPRVFNCTFTNNLAIYDNPSFEFFPGSGGAVDSSSTSFNLNSLRFENTFFIDNHAAWYGGAVHLVNVESAAFIGCTFISRAYPKTFFRFVRITALC